MASVKQIASVEAHIASRRFLDEHIASRKDLCAYLDMSTAIHRADIARTEKFLAELRARLEQAERQCQAVPRSF